MQPPADQIISVKAFLDILNETLGFAFPAVTVEGEVSGFGVSQNKWVRFDLKDQDAKMGCFMVIHQLKVPLEDGMKVRVTGRPRIYSQRGQFSFNVQSISLSGEGELKRAFEILKQKLSAEGLFAVERKRILPKFPQTIGLITSGTSAAYADFLKILGQRWGGVNIQLADVQVQGVSSPDQIVRAIHYFNQLPTPPDVLVIIRGGGSMDDLQSFNTESVAREIAGSRTPTLVGVGHEIDTTLADYAADKRAATPTDAARIVVPDKHQIEQLITHHQTNMLQMLRKQLNNYMVLLTRMVNSLERFVRLPQMHTIELQARLIRAQHLLIDRRIQKLDSLKRLMASFDPTATLKRGYAIARSGDKVIIRSSQVKEGDNLMIQLAEGNINSTVNK